VRGECLHGLVDVAMFRKIHEPSQMVLLLFMTELLSSNNLSIVCVHHRPSKNFTLLLINVTHREPRSCLYLSIIALVLSASLSDPRLWSEVLSTSACMTKGLLFSG